MLGRRWISWLLATLLAASLLALGTSACSTQAAYPTKAIELVVAFAPGGGTDVVARVMAKYLSTELGVPVNVSNKAGGNQIPGVMSVLSAQPDGYTLLTDQQATSSLHGIVKDLPYKMEERTFGPMMAAGPNAYVVAGKSPYNSLKDVMDAAKKDPASFTWQRLGGTSVTDFSELELFDAAGIDVSKTKPVAFDGCGPGITAVAGGHVVFGACGAGSTIPLKSSGDLKVLGVTGDQRMPTLADVPSAKEAGYPSADIVGWYAVSGPKNLPKNVLDRLDAAAKKLSADANFAKDLEGVASFPKYMTPDQLKDYVLKETETFKKLSEKFNK